MVPKESDFLVKITLKKAEMSKTYAVVQNSPKEEVWKFPKTT
jgi:hypothetical protein